MKALPLVVALFAASTMTGAFAEGGADRLKQRSDQWAQQRQEQQRQEALVKQDNQKATKQVERPAS